ncbi:MAG TPA: hydrolase [Rhodobacteraceae bacterium]|nr:hydrolase [Paracoccaceae bacterium]HBV54773.1 hydrolase [Paracoccaceae bacterium]
MSARIDAQLAFLMEADRLKAVNRASRIADGSRFENSAEHSWHVALFALTLAEHAPDGTDTARAIKMLLLHDLVEIDAGDAPIFGDSDAVAMAAKEAAAAERLFGLLPPDQARDFRALWDEFEANETPTARYAKSLDRFVPPNLNLANGGGSWTDYNVGHDAVTARIGPKISNGTPALWDWIAPKIRVFFSG